MSVIALVALLASVLSWGIAIAVSWWLYPDVFGVATESGEFLITPTAFVVATCLLLAVAPTVIPLAVLVLWQSDLSKSLPFVFAVVCSGTAVGALSGPFYALSAVPLGLAAMFVARRVWRRTVRAQ